MTNLDKSSEVQISYISLIYNTFINLKKKFYRWQYLNWVILVVSALNVICIGGKRRAFGIFVAALKDSYNQTSMTELNWIGDSYAALGFFLMPFVTTLIINYNRSYRLVMLAAGLLIFVSCMTSAMVTNPGYLFITHTLLHGVGSSLILCGTSLVTGEYFDKLHRFHVLATTFISGGPYGVLLLGPLFSYWIQNYGWQKAFEFSGILFLIVIWLGAIAFISRKEFEYNLSISDQNENGTDRQVNELVYIPEPNRSSSNNWGLCSLDHLKQNPQVIIWGLERLIHNLVVYGLLMNLTSYVSDSLNNEIVKGAKVNFYFGIGESIIFTVGALVGDKIRGHLPLTYLIGAIFASLFLILMQTNYKDLNVVYILAGFTGSTVGVGNTFLYATAEEVMLIHGSLAFPMTKMVAGIGMILAPLFSGLVIDTFNYNGFFISMSVLVSLRVVLLAFICYILKEKKRLYSTEKVDEIVQVQNIPQTISPNNNNNNRWPASIHEEKVA